MAEIPDETQFGRLVVERQLATREELRRCMKQQKQLERSGNRVALSNVMIDSGFITKSQFKRLKNDLDDSVYKPSQQIPGFQMIGKLGAGAMATVFKARQLSLDRIVAIKVLPKKLSANEEFVERFYKEGRAAARLNHNNIVQAIDVGEAGGYHYFVMEYVEGHTVSDEMPDGKKCSEADALAIIIQVARALEHAHDKGFIHRDVKSKNIMLTPDRVAKLADMGLAREACDVESAVSEAGRAYGTPYYISPEQVRGEVDIDFRTDIYSLVATSYHMVTGKVPFDGSTPAAVMHKHLKEPLVPPDHVNGKLSTGLAEIIERTMAKDRDRRYACTTDLLIDLEKLKRGEAPLQARSGYKHELLENLADGRSDDSEPVAHAYDAGPGPANTNALLVVVIAMGAFIAVLLTIIIALLVSK